MDDYNMNDFDDVSGDPTLDDDPIDSAYPDKDEDEEDVNFEDAEEVKVKDKQETEEHPIKRFGLGAVNFIGNAIVWVASLVGSVIRAVVFGDSRALNVKEQVEKEEEAKAIKEKAGKKNKDKEENSPEHEKDGQEINSPNNEEKGYSNAETTAKIKAVVENVHNRSTRNGYFDLGKELGLKTKLEVDKFGKAILYMHGGPKGKSDGITFDESMLEPPKYSQKLDEKLFNEFLRYGKCDKIKDKTFQLDTVTKMDVSVPNVVQAYTTAAIRTALIKSAYVMQIEPRLSTLGEGGSPFEVNEVFSIPYGKETLTASIDRNFNRDGGKSQAEIVLKIGENEIARIDGNIMLGKVRGQQPIDMKEFIKNTCENIYFGDGNEGVISQQRINSIEFNILEMLGDNEALLNILENNMENESNESEYESSEAENNGYDADFMDDAFKNEEFNSTNEKTNESEKETDEQKNYEYKSEEYEDGETVDETPENADNGSEKETDEQKNYEYESEEYEDGETVDETPENADNGSEMLDIPDIDDFINDNNNFSTQQESQEIDENDLGSYEDEPVEDDDLEL